MARYKVFAIVMYLCLLGSLAELLPPPLLDQPSDKATKPLLEDVLSGVSNATKSILCAITDTNCGESIVLVCCGLLRSL